MRLEGKVAIVMGAGQTPGSTVGNGRACALLFAREGAKVLAVEKDPASAEETRCRNTHATPFRGSRPSTSMVMYSGVSPTVSRMVSQY